MIEALVVVWIAVIGVVLLIPVSDSLSRWGTICVAPLIGAAAYTLAGLVLVTARVFTTVGALGLATVGAAAVAVVGFVVLRPALRLPKLLVAFGGGLLLAVGVSIATQSFPLTRLSTDSFHYLVSASVLEKTGSLHDIIPIFLLKRQLATPMLHTVGILTGTGYSASTTPYIAVGTIATMMWLAVTAFRRLEVSVRWGIAIGAATLALLLTTNRVLFHIFYVNGHMLFAGFLLVGVGLAWYGAWHDRWLLVLPATLTFAALVPLRAEAVMVAALFLVPIVTAAVTPQWASWVLVVPMAATTIVWYVIALPPHLPETDLGLTGSVYGNAWVVATLVALVALRHISLLRPWLRYSPWVMVAALIGFVAIQAWRDFPLLFDSVTGMASGLAATGRWSAFWWAVPVLFVAALLAGVVPLERFFNFGIAAFPLALLAFAYLRGSSYGGHPGDSANRMMMHIVPIVVLYLMLAAGTLAARVDAESESTVAAPSSGAA